MNLTLSDKYNKYVSFYKCLGFTLDEHLHYTEHVKDMRKKINHGLQIMRRVKDFLPQESLILLANSLVLSHLDYCSPLLHNLNSTNWIPYLNCKNVVPVLSSPVTD